MTRLLLRLAGLAVLLLGLAGRPAFAAEEFVHGVDDLPLMPGLTSLAGEGVVFDVPGGRVVEAWAEGRVTRAAVRSFYGSTLPQLGWTAAGPDLFRREGETLRLEFPAAGPRDAHPSASGALRVRFYLSPG